MKKIVVCVPNNTQLLHLVASIDRDTEIHYESKFCDLRDGKTEFKLDSCDEENKGSDFDGER
jgi:hypothetical protein